MNMDKYMNELGLDELEDVSGGLASDFLLHRYVRIDSTYASPDKDASDPVSYEARNNYGLIPDFEKMTGK